MADSSIHSTLSRSAGVSPPQAAHEWPNAAVVKGDAATLLGQEGEARVDAAELARGAGTIAYTVLCGIAARVKKIYV